MKIKRNQQVLKRSLTRLLVTAPLCLSAVLFAASFKDASTTVATTTGSQPLSLGQYPDTSLPLSANTTVTPDAAPSLTTSITASTSTNFKGTFLAYPTTGVLRVTDAHPAGTYQVTVRAFNGGLPTGTTTFNLTVTTPQTCTPVSFAPPATFPGGSNPVVGDFNDDGKQDLVTASTDQQGVSILLGDGAGHFGAPTNFALGTNAWDLAVGDFNGDGRQDVAVADYLNGSGNLSILLGDGRGQLGTPINTNVGGLPYSLAVGDFNNDGKQDVAEISDPFTVRILLGDGTGHFTNAGNFDAGVEDYQIAVGDFNNDGNQDLAVTDDLYPGTCYVSILLGDGTGHFSTPTAFTIGLGPNNLAVGDLNGDGKQDLAVSNPDSNNISILLGNGAGGFGAATSFGAGDRPYGLVFGDFNGDGKQDLAVSNGESADISILLGNGAGGFSSGISIPGNAGAVGDFNGDGMQDLAGGGVIILLRQCASPTPTATATGTATPTATGTPTPPTLGNYPNRTILLSRDTTVTPDATPTNTTRISVFTSTNFQGLLEGDPMTGAVRVTNANPAGTYTVTVKAFNGAGQTATTTFILTVTPVAAGCSLAFSGGGFGVDLAPESIAVGDFNGDGHQDVVTANALSGNVSISFGNGAGTFTPVTNLDVGSNPLSVAVGDFDGDGTQDLVTANSGANNVSILLGDGTGNFSAPTNFNAGNRPYSVAVGDFNGDGNKDLAVANADSNNVSILLGDGAGNFSSPTHFDAGMEPHSVAVGDFNGDGKHDLAVTNYNSNNVSILLGDGTGGFGPAANFSAGTGAHALVVGDFNNDGKQDLAVTDLGGSFSHNVSILLGDGAGHFSLFETTGAVLTANGLTLGDFNGDGKQDLVVVGTYQTVDFHEAILLLGNGTGHFTSGTRLDTGTGPHAVEVGDFNADGKQDIAVANSTGNSVSIFLQYCQPSPPPRQTATATSTATATPTATVRPSATPTPTPTATVAATPTPTPCLPVITQSSSQTITTANSASCNNGATHTDNSYWRAFNMATSTSGSQYCINSVSFGVEFANVTQPVTVRLYTTSNFPAGFPGSLTQIAATTVNVGSAQNGTVVTTPLTATVPVGTPQLVMELFTADGQAGGYRFFVGSNAASETGPSYFSAPACGIMAPTTTAASGFPNMHVVFDLNGSCCPAPTPCPFFNLSGTVGQCTTAGPSGVPLAGVTMTLTSTEGSTSTTTNSSGNYFLAGSSCVTNTLTPSKADLTPGSTGIDTVDVIAIQRHFLIIGTPLSGCRLTAADVNGIGGITTVDVIAVQRFFLGLTSGISNVGKYQFTPASRSYSPPISNQTGQNHDAIVFGDVVSQSASP